MGRAVDDTADIVMTVVVYTPGRFLRTEVFDLPLMMTDPVATSKADIEMVETDMSGGEYDAAKVLGAWVHGPGVIHTKDGMSKREDMEDLKLWGPTRVITDMLKELGGPRLAYRCPPSPRRCPRAWSTAP